MFNIYVLVYSFIKLADLFLFIFSAVGLQLGDDTILRSIATALYLNGRPITGQNKPKALLDKSPGVYINPTQPLVLVCITLLLLMKKVKYILFIKSLSCYDLYVSYL